MPELKITNDLSQSPVFSTELPTVNVTLVLAKKGGQLWTRRPPQVFGTTAIQTPGEQVVWYGCRNVPVAQAQAKLTEMVRALDVRASPILVGNSLLSWEGEPARVLEQDLWWTIECAHHQVRYEIGPEMGANAHPPQVVEALKKNRPFRLETFVGYGPVDFPPIQIMSYLASQRAPEMVLYYANAKASLKVG